MILDTKTMIPQVYSKERDIQVFNKLLDIILTSCKYSIDNIGDLYDAFRCPEELLPLLAYNLNYKYNFADTVTSNRRIIDAFVTLERNRGSRRGLRMATALSLTSLDISKNNAEIQEPLEFSDSIIEILSEIEIRFDYNEARIEIDYPNTYQFVRYILDYVRPVGMTVQLRAVNGHDINADVMLLYADVEAQSRKYIPEIDSYVSRSFVNLSGIADNRWIEGIESMFNQTNDNEYTMNLGGGD